MMEEILPVLERFVLTPLEHPELLPSLLPLILGALVLELYFGKYTTEELGWNSSVANAVIWITTGITLLLTSELGRLERRASYFLIGIGSVVGYLNFYHKWPSTAAFAVSSAGIVYSLAYVTVVVVKTSLEVNPVTLKAAAAFIIGSNIGFKLLQGLETPSRDQFQLGRRGL